MNIVDDRLILGQFDHQAKTFTFLLNGQAYTAQPGEIIIAEGHKIMIVPQGTKFISIIEVAEVKGVGFLMILSIMYLLFLYISDREEVKQ